MATPAPASRWMDRWGDGGCARGDALALEMLHWEGLIINNNNDIDRGIENDSRSPFHGNRVRGDSPRGHPPRVAGSIPRTHPHRTAARAHPSGLRRVDYDGGIERSIEPAVQPRLVAPSAEALHRRHASRSRRERHPGRHETLRRALRALPGLARARRVRDPALHRRARGQPRGCDGNLGSHASGRVPAHAPHAPQDHHRA